MSPHGLVHSCALSGVGPHAESSPRAASYDGGQRIDVGIDDNRDGVLQTGEIDATSYVCNGGPPSVLLLGGSTLAPTSIDSAGATLRTNLQALTGFGGFGTIDVLNASSAATVVTAATLKPYKVVLVWTNGGGFGDGTAVGNALGDYIEAGGHVVLAVFASCSNVGGMPGGKFATSYRLQDYATQSGGTTTLGTVTEPSSILMSGVTAWASTFAYQCNGAVRAGTTTVASYADGNPLIMRGTPGGFTRADLNIYPGLTQPELTRIIRNALYYH